MRAKASRKKQRASGWACTVALGLLAGGLPFSWQARAHAQAPMHAQAPTRPHALMHAQALRPGPEAVFATAAVAGGSLPASIPVQRELRREDSGDAGERWWLAIPALTVLLIVAVVLVRRNIVRGTGSAPGGRARLGGLLDTVSSHEIARVSATRLSPRHSLHVVVWRGRRLLLGCTEGAMVLLAESGCQPDAADAKSNEGAP